MSAYLGTGAVRTFIVPQTPPPDLAVAPNFERFDGLSEPPLDNPAGSVALGADYGATPRPGQLNTPVHEQTYTPSPVSGLVGTLGGQPLPVGDWKFRPPGTYSPGQGKIIGGPKRGRQAYQGIAQTVFLSEITDNPPQPGDLASIIAGQA